MFNKFVSIGLVFTLLAFTSVKPLYSQSDKDDEKTDKKIEKIKKGIKKLGTGEDAKIKIKLKDKTKVKGHVKEAGDNDFTIIEKNTGNERNLEYSEIRHVSGKNIPLGVKIAIGVGIGIAVAIIIFEVVFHTVIDN